MRQSNDDVKALSESRANKDYVKDYVKDHVRDEVSILISHNGSVL